ncbi:TonB-dependent receptor [Arenibacter sp. ARW7G5Y1]|uniref:SusC/RagA family TonB-linked outer membrane protein n=1 Tax=Arenibacter sp. ARW7G5Y1 TaxID=2135619 RepID=UPI000D773CD7|nr:TonB-dependent receptor [Arenibacter sp. ARW7G5Y1]PXX21665.1 TonB-linked SusC/RagA family outer membrane protein [Arenibacter sp. ARW7G5Y1]
MRKNQFKNYFSPHLLIVLLLLSTTSVFAQTTQITGTVKDSGGNLIPGATVVEKGTANGVATNFDGEYIIEVESGATLRFSYIGMLAQEIIVGGQTTHNVVLEEGAIGLEEVVLTGYGKQKKANLTGAVGVLNAEALENRPVVNAYQALQGVMPGLNLTVNSSSSEPGGTYNVNIRGYTSINGGEPLVLIDGVKSNLQMVNTADIENITILKDQASSAIYGAQAAYGVLMITTKSGKSGKMTIEYSNNLSNRSPLVLPKNMNSLDFANYFNAAASNDNLSNYFDDDAISRIKAYQDDPVNTPVAIPQSTNPNIWGKHWWSNANTDWYSAIYKQNVFDQQHNLNVGGGSENIRYYISGSYLQQDGLVRYGDPTFNKYTINSRIDAKINNWVRINFDSKQTTQKLDRPTFLSTTLYTDLSVRWPNNYIRDPNGFLSDFSEVKKLEQGGRHIEEFNYYNNTTALIFEPIKNWITNFSLTKGNTFTEFDETVIPIWQYGVDKTPVGVQGVTSYKSQKTKNAYTTASIYSTFEKRIQDHYFKVMTGWQYEYNKYTMVNGRRQNLIIDDVTSLSAASGDQFVADNQFEWANNGFFGRLNYNYQEKYLLEINARADGASVFPKESRWGLFPSISGGYVLSQEKYWSSLTKFVDYFKISASYGELGNQSVSTGSTNQRYYPYIATMPVNLNSNWIFPDNSRTYVGAPGLISSDLTWETVKGWNFGIKGSSLNHRLSIELDVYKRITENMMGPVASLPAILGTSAPMANNATLATKGYEILLNWKDQINDFKYSISASLADYKGEIIEYNNPTMLNNTYYKGSSIGDIWGYVTEGIFQSDDEVAAAPSQTAISSIPWKPGDVKYKDINGDNIIDFGNNTVTNPGDRTIIGNTTPRYNYGLTFSGDWKGFDFNMFWQGVGQRDLWVSNTLLWGMTGPWGIWSSSGFEPHLDYWREDNKDAYYPRPLASSFGKNQQVQSRYLIDAAYIRLKSLQLGYTIPTKIMNKFSVQKCRVFIAGENLLTFSKVLENFDPEVINNGISYPIQKALSVGINISL